MVTSNITLSRNEDNSITYNGEKTKVVETDSMFINYFFFSATSIDYRESTMVLSYGEYPGWNPTAYIVVCNTEASGKLYAVKVEVPKFFSTTNATEFRDIYISGTIKTTSPTIKSDYNFSIKANGCVEENDNEYIIRYSTENDYDAYKIQNTDIVLNTKFIVERNMDFFGNDTKAYNDYENTYSDDMKQAKMLNIVARVIWGDMDSDFSTCSSTTENYAVCSAQQDDGRNRAVAYGIIGGNQYKHNESNEIDDLRAGFFEMNGNVPRKIEIKKHRYTSKKDGEFVFKKPVEAIGYHTFFFGRHYNTAFVQTNDGYFKYDDNGGNRRTFSTEEVLSTDNKLNCARGITRNQRQLTFVGCDKIVSIKTGKYLKIIGNQAFKALSGLTSIDFEGSNLERIGMFAFEGTKSLKDIDIPNTVELMGEGAFKRSGITGITIPRRLEIIEAETFRNCEGLKELRFEDGCVLKKISANSFRWCNNIGFNRVTFPSSLKRIERMAFAECVNLNTITFNNGIEYIGTRAFSKCNSLGNIEIPAATIGMRAFEKCEGLKTVALKSTVRSIGEGAFYKSNVETLSIENGIRKIGDKAFMNMERLTGVTIPNSVTTVGNMAFYACRSLNTIELGTGVEDILKEAFEKCGLTSITFGNRLRTIGEKAFASTDIKSIELPNSVKTIGEGAFYACVYLETVTIPFSVTEIGAMAFTNCSRLSLIKYKGTSAQWLNNVSCASDWCNGTRTNEVYCEGDGVTIGVR